MLIRFRDPIRIFNIFLIIPGVASQHAAGQQVQCGVNQIKRGSSPHCFWTRLDWTNKGLSFFDVLLLYSPPFVTPPPPPLRLSPFLHNRHTSRGQPTIPRCKVCRGPVRFASFDSRGGCYWRRMLFVGLRNRDGVIRVAGRQREPVWHLRTLEGTVFLERGKGVLKRLY